MVRLLPAPMWFEILDLTLVYLPMGWLAYKIGIGSHEIKQRA